MEALQSPRPPPLRTVLSAQIRALVSSDDGDAVQNVIMLGLLLIAAVSRSLSRPPAPATACLRLVPALSTFEPRVPR